MIEYELIEIENWYLMLSNIIKKVWRLPFLYGRTGLPSITTAKTLA